MSTRRTTRKSQPIAGGASIYDVAQRADVSIVTVSRVFNDYPHVSRRMRERVFEAARAVGYTPRLVSKPHVLAAIVGHLDHLSAGDYKTRLLLYIVQAAARVGYLVEFIPADSVELATKHLVDGVIEVGLTDEEMLRLTHLPQVPIVVINKKPRPEWSSVTSDHFYEGQLATEHLVGRGHRRIALVLDDAHGWGVEQRREGYESAARAGVKGFKPLVFCTEETPPTDIAHKMADARCTACVNFTDNFGFAVLDSCIHDLHMRIPDNLSVVCLENKSVSPYYNPKLTTIEQPLQMIAEGAVNGIIDLLSNSGRRFERTFKCRLIERESVRPAS
jgi:DNA-binding LacI/PurR family transcriptional regulator